MCGDKSDLVFILFRMNYSISFNSVLKLRHFIDVFQPVKGYNDFAKDVKEGIKLTKLNSQKNYLEKLLAKGEATPEVIALARRGVHQVPDRTRRFRQEERIIMKNRIEEK